MWHTFLYCNYLGKKIVKRFFLQRTGNSCIENTNSFFLFNGIKLIFWIHFKGFSQKWLLFQENVWFNYKRDQILIWYDKFVTLIYMQCTWLLLVLSFLFLITFTFTPVEVVKPASYSSLLMSSMRWRLYSEPLIFVVALPSPFQV